MVMQAEADGGDRRRLQPITVAEFRARAAVIGRGMVQAGWQRREYRRLQQKVKAVQREQK